jgi:hypothetical protein
MYGELGSFTKSNSRIHAGNEACSRPKGLVAAGGRALLFTLGSIRCLVNAAQIGEPVVAWTLAPGHPIPRPKLHGRYSCITEHPTAECSPRSLTRRNHVTMPLQTTIGAFAVGSKDTGARVAFALGSAHAAEPALPRGATTCASTPFASQTADLAQEPQLRQGWQARLSPSRRIALVRADEAREPPSEGRHTTPPTRGRSDPFRGAMSDAESGRLPPRAPPRHGPTRVLK